MKKRNEDDPDNLGGLGDMLPAEVLKMLNELLEQMHRKGCLPAHSSINGAWAFWHTSVHGYIANLVGLIVCPKLQVHVFRFSPKSYFF